MSITGDERTTEEWRKTQGRLEPPLISVTTPAAGARLRAREILETNNLADITAADDVIGSRSVTGLAPVTAFQCRLKVRSRLEVFRVRIFVARLAGIGTHVLRSLHNRTCGGTAASCISGKTGQGGHEQDHHNQRRPTHKFCSLLHVKRSSDEESSRVRKL
jgi:hypothetical protein